VAEKQEILKFCPFTRASEFGMGYCLGEECALYVEEAGRCCLWMLAFHLERVRVEVADLAVTVEAK